MKSKLVSILVLVSLSLCANAQAKGDTVSSEKIRAIESAYSSLSDMTADFTQTTEIALLDRKVKKHGIFQFKKGGMMRIEYKGRKAKHYVSDGSTLWVYMPGDETSLQTFAVNDDTVPREAMSFMSGFGKLTKEFSVSGSDAFKKAPKGSTALHLVPKKKGAKYESLDALFGPDDMLVGLIVHNESGNVSRYNFSNFRKNQGLADGHFSLSSGKATPDTLPQ